MRILTNEEFELAFGGRDDSHNQPGSGGSSGGSTSDKADCVINTGLAVGAILTTETGAGAIVAAAAVAAAAKSCLAAGGGYHSGSSHDGWSDNGSACVSDGSTPHL